MGWLGAKSLGNQILTNRTISLPLEMQNVKHTEQLQLVEIRDKHQKP